MSIAFSDYLSHDFFPLFIVTVWMCLRQINVLSLPGSQEPIYYNLSLDPASVQIASVCLIIQLGYIGGLHLNDGKSVNISDSSDGVSIANFFTPTAKNSHHTLG